MFQQTGILSRDGWTHSQDISEERLQHLVPPVHCLSRTPTAFGQLDATVRFVRHHPPTVQLPQCRHDRWTAHSKPRGDILNPDDTLFEPDKINRLKVVLAALTDYSCPLSFVCHI